MQRASYVDDLAKIIKDSVLSSNSLESTTKAIQHLTNTSAKAAGFPGYVWRTQRDGRVRSSHARMEGTYHLWDNPPIVDGRPVHAGMDMKGATLTHNHPGGTPPSWADVYSAMLMGLEKVSAVTQNTKYTVILPRTFPPRSITRIKNEWKAETMVADSYKNYIEERERRYMAIAKKYGFEFKVEIWEKD